MPRMDETGFGLLQGELLPTPKALEVEEDYQTWKARMERSGNPKNIGKVNAPLGTLAVSGLLPTPMANDIHHAQRVKALKDAGAETMASRKNGSNRPNGLIDYMDFQGLLPTPTSRDDKNGTTADSQRTQRKMKQGWTIELNDMATMGLLPTPATRDWKGARSEEALEEAGRNHTNSLPDAFAQTGRSSQLNPRFVAEMMGFPVNWTELPFLSGEPNPSKPTGMP